MYLSQSTSAWIIKNFSWTKFLHPLTNPLQKLTRPGQITGHSRFQNMPFCSTIFFYEVHFDSNLTTTPDATVQDNLSFIAVYFHYCFGRDDGRVGSLGGWVCWGWGWGWGQGGIQNPLDLVLLNDEALLTRCFNIFKALTSLETGCFWIAWKFKTLNSLGFMVPDCQTFLVIV